MLNRFGAQIMLILTTTLLGVFISIRYCLKKRVSVVRCFDLLKSLINVCSARRQHTQYVYAVAKHNLVASRLSLPVSRATEPNDGCNLHISSIYYRLRLFPCFIKGNRWHSVAYRRLTPQRDSMVMQITGTQLIRSFRKTALKLKNKKE